VLSKLSSSWLTLLYHWFAAAWIAVETQQSWLVAPHLTMERGWRESVDDLFLQLAAATGVVRS
jgi:hypothetical protein